MRLKITKSKNAMNLYVIESTYINGKHSSRIVEKLGNYDELKKTLNGRDPIEWAKEYIQQLNEKLKEDRQEVIVKYSPNKIIKKDEQHVFNGGYLFLQQLYYELGLDKICKDISDEFNFTYDLNSILSRLVYARIIYPSSKRSTYKLSKKFIEQPKFELHHIYRALEVIAKKNDYIQTELYKNSSRISKRNTGILYYDCTNFFFEIEYEDGFREYGVSKEHRPNPIVQMGLFMDGDGIPLAFSINNGSQNEQVTLKPLEKKIIKDFNLSKFVVCTDAGLASYNNKKFNDLRDRAYITTQSIKKLPKYLKDWALDPDGWHLFDNKGSCKVYNITELDEEEDVNKIFFKERWKNEKGLEERVIVTYSLKYKNYQQKIRNNQIERAKHLILTNPSKYKLRKNTDFKRLVEEIHLTPDGEVAQTSKLRINEKLICEEERYDGFYAVCTNLEDDAHKIIKVNKNRWVIEECFRIMKSEFKVRPVHLSREDRIIAHFITCFIALIIYRLLEKKLGDEFTYHEIIDNLREMNFYQINHDSFVPIYTRNDFTDALHESFGFRTDYQILTKKIIKNIISNTKTKKVLKYKENKKSVIF